MTLIDIPLIRPSRTVFGLNGQFVNPSLEKITQRPTVAGNLGLARREALPFCKPRERVEDTDQYSDALDGLNEAVMKYRPKMGKFSTIAIECIRRKIYMGHRWRQRKKREMFTVDSNELDGIPATPDEVELPLELLSKFLEEKSDDSPAFKRKKQILISHFIEEKSWAEIGRETGVTRAAARQLGQAAIQEIRNKHQFLIEQFA